jgi:hypothetical protein
MVEPGIEPNNFYSIGNDIPFQSTDRNFIKLKVNILGNTAIYAIFH